MSGGEDRSVRPGPVYDNAMRHLGEAELFALLSYLGFAPGSGATQLSGALPAATMYADLVADLGGGHLVHVEFVRRIEDDLAMRMVEYHARIHAREKRRGLTSLTHDPEQLLTSPGLAPLAVLGRAPGRDARQDIFRRALRVIARVPDSAHRHALARVAATLAGIHLGPHIIEALTKEAAMPITLDEDTVAGRAIAAAAEARGEARGRVVGRATTLAGLLRRTFGDDPRIDAIAEHLAGLPQEQALDAALGATTLDDLAPPT